MAVPTPYNNKRIGSDTSWIRLPINELLMVCAWCKRFRDTNGEWQRMGQRNADEYSGRTSHGMCPECACFLIRQLDAAPRVQHLT
jgi:hypothetical protein